MRNVILVIAGVSIFLSQAALAEPQIADADLRQAVDELSSSTLVCGQGWKTYERFLHPKYARWAMGEIYERRKKFIDSLEEWWNYGMRVAKRTIEIVAVDTIDDLAIIRFKTTETFIGPDGVTTGFSGYVSNTWIKVDGNWLLLSAEISSIARDDR